MNCILDKTDLRFDSDKVSDYRLSVLLHNKQFSFLVTDYQSNYLFKLAVYKLNEADANALNAAAFNDKVELYKSFLSLPGFAELNYRKVEIAFSGAKVSVIPPDFVTFGNKKNIVSAAYTVADWEEILTESVFAEGPAIASLFPAYIRQAVESVFPDAWMRNASAVFIKAVMKKYSQTIIRQIFLNFHDDFFELSVIQGSLLLYLNSFKYSEPADVLYFVLFVLEQLGFVSSEENIIVMGETDEDSEVYKLLEMYCNTLHFVHTPNDINFGDIFRSVNLHHHFILLNMPVCE